MREAGSADLLAWQPVEIRRDQLVLMPVRAGIAPTPSPSLLSALGGAIREHLGPELSVRTRIGANSRRAAYEQAANHPMIQAILQRFDGEIIGQELLDE